MCTLQQRPIVGAGSGNDIHWRNASGHHGTIGQGRPLVSNHSHLVTSGGNNGYWTGYDNQRMQPRGDGRRFTEVGTASFSDPVHYVDGGHRIPSPRSTQNHGGTINQVDKACIGLQSVQPPTINDLIGSLNISNQPPNHPSVTSTYCRVTGIADHDEDSDSSDDDSQTHPNKYPVEIEEHNSKFCGHSRQHSRSGTKIKQRVVTINDPITLEPTEHTQHIKSYQKHLVRVCRCGRYPQMDGALTHGRSNDCDGYEIHYNQKCKWKAYDDFKTGKRVLIRLCKCYKPSL